MQLNRSFFATTLVTAACTLFVGLLPALQAADAAAGTWSWTMAGRQGGEPRKMTLTLKVEGGKLTGKLSAPGRQGGEARDTEISDGKIKGDEISFNVVREYNGNKMTTKYSGKVTGDTLKGKIETERDGQTRSRDWEAKREPAKK
jgi:hypothetical protein